MFPLSKRVLDVDQTKLDGAQETVEEAIRNSLEVPNISELEPWRETFDSMNTPRHLSFSVRSSREAAAVKTTSEHSRTRHETEVGQTDVLSVSVELHEVIPTSELIGLTTLGPTRRKILPSFSQILVVGTRAG